MTDKYEDLINKDGFYITYTIMGIQARQNSSYDIFFTAHNPCEVLWVAERHAGNNTGAFTLQVVKCADAVAVASGSALLSTAFDLDATTADTLQIREGNTLVKTGTTQLKEGDSLGILKTGTINNVLHVTITLYLKRLGKGDYN